MSQLDRTSPQASVTDEAQLLEPLDEPPLLKQVSATFRGRSGWLAMVACVGIPAAVIFAVVAAVCFFRAEGLREMIAWAGGFGLGLLFATTGRLWFWMLLYKNTVLREVRRVEMQVARLSSQLNKPK
jgi:hypothetical protein